MSLFRLTLLAAATLVIATACADPGESLGPVASLTFSSAPDLEAKVTQVQFESAIGPGFGAYEQYDVWLAVAPSVTSNAGVVVPKSGPVFVRSADGVIHAGSGATIRTGDAVQIWRTQGVAYGAVQGPPNSPTYEARQIVIVR